MIDKTDSYPKISIITPSFNQGEFIEDTIISVISQNYPNLEYIIIDGGSTDNTIEIIKKYEEKINYWRSQPDRGQSHAINKGIKVATGEIINWLNSDDLLTENALFEIAKAFHQHTDSLMVSANGWNLEQNGEKGLVGRPVDKDELNYLISSPFCQPACYFRKSVLQEIGLLDENFNITMDRDLYVRIALNGHIKEIEYPVAIFRIHKDQKTFYFHEEWHQDRLKVFSRLIRTFPTAAAKYTASLQKAGLYHQEDARYTTNKTWSTTKINKIIAGYLINLAHINYTSKRFQQTRIITNWVKKNLPVFFTPLAHQLNRRSLVFRIPFTYSIIKIIQKFITA